MQNVNKQLGNGSIIHICSYYKHILEINKVQTYSNVLSILVNMFFNHLTSWLKPHRKKTLNRKQKFKTRLMVQNTGLRMTLVSIIFRQFGRCLDFFILLDKNNIRTLSLNIKLISTRYETG